MSLRVFILITFSIGVLAGLFWLLQPQPQAESPGSPARPDAGPPESVLEVRHGHLVAGPDTIRATQGEPVHITVVSDQDAELHLHGYDLRLPVQAGTPVMLAFVAEHSGRFELELHGAGHGGHQALSVIEIAPR